MNIYRTGLLLVVAALLASPSITFGITLGQIDTFEDGTKQGWNNGSAIGVQPGGPAGSGDHYFPILLAVQDCPIDWKYLTDHNGWVTIWRPA